MFGSKQQFLNWVTGQMLSAVQNSKGSRRGERLGDKCRKVYWIAVDAYNQANERNVEDLFFQTLFQDFGDYLGIDVDISNFHAFYAAAGAVVFKVTNPDTLAFIMRGYNSKQLLLSYSKEELKVMNYDWRSALKNSKDFSWEPSEMDDLKVDPSDATPAQGDVEREFFDILPEY